MPDVAQACLAQHLAHVFLPCFPDIFGQPALWRLRPDMLKEIEHGRAEPADALARFWIGGLWRFARVTGLVTSLRRLGHRTHPNTGCRWIGHRQFADVSCRIVGTLTGCAGYR